MKSLIALIAFIPLIAFAGGEMKKVCHPDAKTKKEVCKTIKVHKKLDGVKVPAK
jgi:hypothetical protein